MKKSLLVAAGALGSLMLAASAAGAAPLGSVGSAGAAADTGLVQKTHGSHRVCELGPAGWHYHSRFRDRRIACRPRRPSSVWIWRSEGGRVGWWHPRERRWH